MGAGTNLAGTALVVTALVTDAGATGLFLAHPGTRSLVAAVLHVVAALLLATGLFLWGRARRPEAAGSWALLGGMLTLMQPVTGGLGAALLCAFQGPRGHEAQDTGTDDEYAPLPQAPLREEQTLEEQVRACARLALPADSEELSEDLARLRELVESVPELGDSEQVRQLTSLAVDPRIDAYHLASARLVRLQEYFTTRLYKARQGLREAPADVQAHVRLGQGYLDYLSSGLVDPALETYYAGMAAEHFEEALRLAPQRYDLYLRCADLNLRLSRYSEALTWCRTALARQPDDVEARSKLLEVLFEASRGGTLEAVQAFCRTLEGMRTSVDATVLASGIFQRSTLKRVEAPAEGEGAGVPGSNRHG